MSERIIKPWGWSQEVYRDELTRVVRIHVEPGGFCSWHKHERQDNRFVVLFETGGMFYVETKDEIGEMTSMVLWPPEFPTVSIPSGKTHRFFNGSHVAIDLLEIYTHAGDFDFLPDHSPDESDIVRSPGSVGGIEKR